MTDETIAPATLDIQECPVCQRNAVDGVCRHCGFVLPEAETAKKAPAEQPSHEA